MLPPLYNHATRGYCNNYTNYQRHDNDPEQLPAKFEEQCIFRYFPQQYLRRYVEQGIEGQPLYDDQCPMWKKRNWHIAAGEKEGDDYELGTDWTSL